MIAKINSDFDSTFATNGIAFFDIDYYDQYAKDMAIQSDGKIVIVCRH